MKPFVGRQELMGRLEGLLEEAVAGRGRILAFAGEPGIGKTRAAEELCAIARSHGMDVAWGSCFEGEGAPLYWPWSLVMRDLLQARGVAAVRRCLGRGAAAVVEVIPSVAEALSEIAPPKPMDNPAMARFRVFDAMAAFVRKAAAERPLVIVLDDLHWADEPTLLLLSFLCRDVATSKVLLVGAYRDGEIPRRKLLEQTLGDLARERVYEHVALHPLDLEDVRGYLEAVRGADALARLAETIYAHTEGNPFLLGEVTRLLTDEPRALEGADGGIPLPETVREVLSKRLDRVSAECRGLLTVAAVIGREFDGRILAAARGEARDGDLLALLDEGMGSGLIEETSPSCGSYRFGHVLTQQALLARLAAGERARLHARIAQALEREYGARVDSHARQLVVHLEQAQVVLGAERLVRYLGIAGEQALGSYAWEEARELFGRAARLRQGQAEDLQTADLLFGLGRAQTALMDTAAASSCSRAFAIYDKAGRADRAVAVAVSGVYSRAEEWGEILGLGERALELVEKDSLNEAAILTEFALWGLLPISREERWRRLKKALRVARRACAPGLEIEVLRRLRALSNGECDFAAAAKYTAQEHALAFREGDLPAQCAALKAIVDLGVSSGERLAEAVRHAEALRSAAEALRDRQWLGVAYFACERLAWRAADWTRAKALCDRYLSVVPVCPGRCSGLLHDALIGYQLNNFDAGDRALAEAVDIAGPLPVWLSPRTNVANFVTQHALMSGRATCLDAAEHFAAEALSDGQTVPESRYFAQAAQGRLAVIRGDAAAAEVCSRNLQQNPAAGAPHLMDPVMGLLAHAAGRRDDAVRLLREAAELAARVEHEFRRMWNVYHLADTLVERSRPGDLEEAERLLGDLLDAAARTGSVLVEGRGRVLLERLRGLPRPAREPSRSGGLTERQVAILGQIAAGKTNKEISYALSISTSTVNAHVRSILSKTGTANRAEAASYATRNGLTEKQPSHRA